MEKVNFIKLNSANVTVDNSADAEKKYSITANVNISGNKVNSIDSGRVIKDDVEVASFSKWGGNQLNVNFNNVDGMEMCTIITEVNAFYISVINKVETEPINI